MCGVLGQLTLQITVKFTHRLGRTATGHLIVLRVISISKRHLREEYRLFRYRTSNLSICSNILFKKNYRTDARSIGILVQFARVLGCYHPAISPALGVSVEAKVYVDNFPLINLT